MTAYRIVLADDHTLFREAVKRGIEKVPGLQVVGEAADGLQLLEVLKNSPPDLVILDISMPNLRGIEATREIKRHYPNVKVLMLTMHKSREYLLSSLKSGADGYLLKENAFSDLVAAIETLRAGKTYISALLMEEMAGAVRELTQGKKEEAKEEEALTHREMEVLKLLAEGKSSEEIARLLYVSVPTVRTHRHNIKRKLKARSNADLVRYAMQKGYI